MRSASSVSSAAKSPRDNFSPRNSWRAATSADSALRAGRLEARGEFRQGLARAFVAGRLLVLQAVDRAVDLGPRAARRLQRARLEFLHRLAAVADFQPHRLGELVDLVVEALLQRRHALLHLAAQAARFLLELLRQLLEAALVVAHLAAEQDVADLVDVALGRVGGGWFLLGHEFAPPACRVRERAGRGARRSRRLAAARRRRARRAGLARSPDLACHVTPWGPRPRLQARPCVVRRCAMRARPSRAAPRGPQRRSRR